MDLSTVTRGRAIAGALLLIAALFLGGRDLAGAGTAKETHGTTQRAGAPQAALGAAPGEGPAAATGPVHLNTATVEQLDELPGVGPVTAQKIIDYREQHGASSSVDDLDAIPGIGPARLEQLRDLVAPCPSWSDTRRTCSRARSAQGWRSPRSFGAPRTSCLPLRWWAPWS